MDPNPILSSVQTWHSVTWPLNPYETHQDDKGICHLSASFRFLSKQTYAEVSV